MPIGVPKAPEALLRLRRGDHSGDAVGRDVPKAPEALLRLRRPDRQGATHGIPRKGAISCAHRVPQRFRDIRKCATPTI